MDSNNCIILGNFIPEPEFVIDLSNPVLLYPKPFLPCMLHVYPPKHLRPPCHPLTFVSEIQTQMQMYLL